MLSDIESLKTKIQEIYRNYGINVSEITDEEYQRMITHYSLNPQELVKDLKHSAKHASMFPDDEVV